jgi:methionine-rich copper-binding protein CopC
MKRIIIAFTIPILALLAQSAPMAAAHSQVVSQSPAPDSEVTVLPTKVEITFNEKLISLGDGNQLQMLDPEGLEVTTGDLVTSGFSISRELNPSAKAGEYYVSYRAVSADGHFVAGEYTFNLTENKVPAIAIAPPPAEDESSEEGRNLLVTAVFIAALLSAGLLLWRFQAKK